MNPNIALACALLACPLARADHPLGGLGLGTAGPITTISASTLPRGARAAALQVEHIAFKDIADERLLELGAQGIEAHAVKSMTASSLRLAYGITDELTVGFKLPYVQRRDVREAHAHDEGGEVELHRLGHAEGVGDLTLLGQYRFLSSGWLEAAALFGVKAPTGRTNRTTAFGSRFETEHQPGSGSWDALAGAALSRRFDALALDASLLYTLAGKGAQDSDLGDRLGYNLAASYRLGGAHEHAAASTEHSHLAWDLVLELNGERTRRQTIAGREDPNSGGNVVYLSPGVRLSGESWSAWLSAGRPVVRHLNGVQHEPDYRLVAGVAARF